MRTVVEVEVDIPDDRLPEAGRALGLYVDDTGDVYVPHVVGAIQEDVLADAKARFGSYGTVKIKRRGGTDGDHPYPL